MVNYGLAGSVEELAARSQRYDFVHSALVFQHIRPAEGYRALRQLVSGLEHGGHGALHFRCRAWFSPRQLARQVRARSGILGHVVTAVRRDPHAAAFIEIHEYEIGSILAVLHAEGVHEVTAVTSVDQGLNVTFFFRKCL